MIMDGQQRKIEVDKVHTHRNEWQIIKIITHSTFRITSECYINVGDGVRSWMCGLNKKNTRPCSSVLVVLIVGMPQNGSDCFAKFVDDRGGFVRSTSARVSEKEKAQEDLNVRERSTQLEVTMDCRRGLWLHQAREMNTANGCQKSAEPELLGSPAPAALPPTARPVHMTAANCAGSSQHLLVCQD
jgi:hypothetical protein